MNGDLQFLATPAGQRFVLLPIETFEALSRRAGPAPLDDPSTIGGPFIDISKDLLSGYSPLAAYRRYRGYSQSDLSERSGISRHTIIRMEAGGRGAGNHHSRQQIADALGIEIGDI